MLSTEDDVENEFVITYDLSERRSYRPVRKEICALGSGRWVQGSVRRLRTRLDAKTIIARVRGAAIGPVALLVIEVRSIAEVSD